MVEGSGSLVLVRGEPGIGKSTLGIEVSCRAAARGIVPVWGRCREERGAPAMWPWSQALADLGFRGDQDLRHLGATAGDIRPLLTGTGGLRAAEGDPALRASRQFRLFTAIGRLLASVGQPFCVLLDDVHRADDGSAALLSHLAVGIDARPR